MSTRGSRSSRLFSLAVALLALTSAPTAHAEPPDAATEEGANEPAEPPPTWRFRHDDKPVKVVVLAGSIGAWPRQPYAEQLENLCANVEVRNISKTGLGAWALKERFEQQVIDNGHLRWNVEGQEHWLVFGGGLNSVGNPRSTNHHMRRLFELAHRRGMKVVGLTLTPWGSDQDKRWRDVNGLKSLRTTRAVVDFIMGRLDPEQALGALASKRRVAADAPWDPSELPDVSIDLHDSPLRDREAPLRDLDEVRQMLAKSKEWQRAHSDLDELQRQTKLEADAREVAEIPRWYMRKELHSFDHIHPNADGHRLMAETMCPSLPESWGCACPSQDDDAADPASTDVGAP
ncbi:SGNH/GDSL hydrolase family protein [Paraliomyxa miuraensis]|uniref:SGNH/GDSL hydrolase family protein n=1 Tax=Paraliomyxa miuraensis TaxID=376150 RepID=UPI002250174F|nr:hypothetical protein [Paraliomyxa miuraensis]MCX4244354.1 hypothetical protein [Paraliomyxa miuraensis]